MPLNNPSFTVGIPSYKSSTAIFNTVKSLQNSEGVGLFEIIVMVDELIADEIKNGLEELGVRLIINKKRAGQTAVNRQIGALVDSEFLVMTQDDVIFDKQTLKCLLEVLVENPSLTMVAPMYMSLPPRTLVERGVQSGFRIASAICEGWNHGDNYLAAVGRCLTYRTGMFQKFQIADEVINCDAYYYFENKRLEGAFARATQAKLYFKTPSVLSEHLKQVRKFMVSQSELSHRLGRDMSVDYALPKQVALHAMIWEFLTSPLSFILYVGLTIYARTRPKSFYAEVTRFWDIDESTKK